tara:strand:- start:183 stop:299 length:117 start_codon:yes stop_codon:yes gene_type:complete
MILAHAWIIEPLKVYILGVVNGKLLFLPTILMGIGNYW